MGFDLGLIEAGLDLAVAQDFDAWCVETIRRNGHKVVPGDIRKLIQADPTCEFLLRASGIPSASLFAVVGGPPCQSFSTAGKRRGIHDERGQLFEQFLYVVDKLRPRFFVMENVKGLASMQSDPNDKQSMAVLDTILSAAKTMGYHTVHGVLDAVHYGAPQFRERLVIIGSRDAEAIFLPAPTHFHLHQNPELQWVTLRQAIGELEGDNRHANFSPRAIRYLSMIPEGGNWRSLPPDVAREAMGGAYESGGGKVGFFRRLSYSEPSPTLVTSPVQKATMLCHPRRLRPLSVREYARIQGFPDYWEFQGSLTDCYRQIGNAVPVQLGAAIGQMLKSVALGTSEIRVKRLRGTSVHKKLALMTALATTR